MKHIKFNNTTQLFLDILESNFWFRKGKLVEVKPNMNKIFLPYLKSHHIFAQNLKLHHKSFVRVPTSWFYFVCKIFFLGAFRGSYLNWRQNCWNTTKRAVFAILCYKWEILLPEEFLLSGFLTQAGKKALLRGSWYHQRTPGGSLILQVLLTNFADPTGLHTLLKAYANCPEPLTFCLLAAVNFYF